MFVLRSRVDGDGLHDLPGRLGLSGGEEDVRPEDGQVQPGELHGALGLHPGHYQHPGLAPAGVSLLHPRQPPGQTAAG